MNSSSQAAQRIPAGEEWAEDDEIRHRVSNGDEVPLSHAQEQLWFLQRLEPGLTAYNLPRMFRLSGPLDADALERAFQAVVDRHGILRTRFFEKDGVPMQQMVRDVAFVLERFDLSGQPEAERQARADALMSEAALHVFDLGAAPALVARLIRLSHEEHVLAVCLHHIVSDAWSNPILAADLASAYRQALAAGAPVRLPALPVQYADYALWQRERLHGEALAKQLAHWNAHLGADVPALELPLDGLRSSRQTFDGAVHRFALEPALAQALQQFCRAEKCTPFVVLLATWQMLLGRCSGQGDFAVGVANAGRHRDEVRDLVGFFITTQVFRARLEPRATLREICRRVRRDSLSALEHADLPLKALLASRNEKRDASRNPLFQVMFGVQMSDSAADLSFGDARTEQIGAGNSSAKFDLSMDFFIEPTRAHAQIEYNTGLFGEATVARLAGWYVRLLEALTLNPDQGFSEVDLCSVAEGAQLAAWGSSTQSFAATEAVHRLIERQAAAHPEAVALVFGDETLSYGELNARANRLAHHLIARGVKPETKVGLAVERSIEMIVGLLAILKAGGAYVPLDPQYPAERLAYMVADSGIALLLTQSHLQPQLPGAEGLQVLALDALDTGSESEADPQVALNGENLAYVIYTSGSTGRPKGAQLCHRNVTRLLDATAPWFRFGPQDVWTMFHSYAFDFSVWEIFGALCTGGRLVIVPFWVSRSPEDFLQLLREQQVTVLNQTPSAFGQLASLPQAYEEEQGLALRVVIFGGEALEPQRLRRWIEHHGDQRPQLVNMYGITETTVHVTYRRITAADLGQARSPVGQAMPDLGLRVLDAQLNPVPIGVTGELHVSGAGLARGYLNRAGLTSERFVAGPGGERLYRTGDLVRWSAEGQLEYLGRIDHQVKVRGFRIELGEIEAQLLAQPEVREATVLADEGPAGTRLVAYVSAQAGHAIDIAGLKGRLGQALPDYMVPAAIVVLQGLPLNTNGKVDRKALPAAEFTSERAYEEPEGLVEGALAAIWGQVLGVPRVGRHDNFFELGGDSLVALKLLARINKSRAFGVKISLQDLLQKQTIARLVAQLDIGAPAEAVQLLNAYAGPVDAMPLFCVPPGLRHPVDYRPIARCLEDSCAVYGLSYTDDIAGLDSIEQMARFYADAIRRTRPQGAVGILGWSLGAVVAVHVASLLEQEGVEVAFLGMVESFLLDERFDPHGWYRDFRDFVLDTATGSMDREAIGATLDSFESVRSGSDEAVRDAVEAIVSAAGIGMKTADIVQGIFATRRMNAITEKITAFPRVNVAPHFWWKKARSAAEKAALLSQFGGEARASVEVDADHQGIVRNAALLGHVHAAMCDAQDRETANAR
ncbi:amino acid adenylation domain-containing protein [Variovorax paradoxus]|uniref:amino acid adenylation domain-containing protein n=1 Tax=Variovorax paradoxus TaxID=34073 RepID=UPI00339343A3